MALFPDRGRALGDGIMAPVAAVDGAGGRGRGLGPARAKSAAAALILDLPDPRRVPAYQRGTLRACLVPPPMLEAMLEVDVYVATMLEVDAYIATTTHGDDKRRRQRQRRQRWFDRASLEIAMIKSIAILIPDAF